MPKLANGCIKFYTNGAGKEEGTKVNVAVRDENDVIAAFISDGFGRFEEHSNSGPFDLTIVNESEKVGIRGGSIDVGFEPMGDELWRFNFFIFLSFSDGTRITGGKVGVELKSDDNGQRFLLDEITR